MKIRLPEVVKSENFTYELYRSTCIAPFRENFEEMTVSKKVRFMLQACRGMIVYYMKRNGEVIGYIALEPGAGFRYPDSKKNDWIISPYTMNPSERGKGYGSALLIDFKNEIFPHLSGNVIAEVRANNPASIRALDKAGFEFSHYAINTKYLKRYVRSNTQSDYLVYVLKR